MEYLKNLRKKSDDVKYVPNCDHVTDIEKLLVDHVWKANNPFIVKRAWNKRHHKIEINWSYLDISYVTTLDPCRPDQLDENLKKILASGGAKAMTLAVAEASTSDEAASDEAEVEGAATTSDQAEVVAEAMTSDEAEVEGAATTSGQAEVVTEATTSDEAEVDGAATTSDQAEVVTEATTSDEAEVEGAATTSDQADATILVVAEAKEMKGKDHSHVCLFETEFRNWTCFEQQFTLSTERTTTSRCIAAWEYGIRVGADVDITFKLPPGWGATGKLNCQLHMTKTNRQEFEEVLKWSVNNQVKVAAKSRATASLLIHEKEDIAKLTLTTTIRPNNKLIDFTVKCRKTGKREGTLHIKSDELDAILKKAKVPYTLVNGKDAKSGLELKSKGVVRLVYGVKQVVDVETFELPITKPNAHKNVR